VIDTGWRGRIGWGDQVLHGVGSEIVPACRSIKALLASTAIGQQQRTAVSSLNQTLNRRFES
jgi:hypothetical protein